MDRLRVRLHEWARRSPPFVVEAVELLRAQAVTDKIDRARTSGDVVVVRIPTDRGQLRRARINLRAEGGSDLAVQAMYEGGWYGFERPLPDLVVRTVRRRQGWFLDVGANTGLYALIAAAARPDVRILAFEAFPPVIDVLRRNIALNVCGARIQVVPQAVADVCGELSLYVPRSVGAVETSCSLDPNFKDDVVEEIKVSSITLDSYWADMGRPEVGAIKIDVEGAEHRVLLGAGALVQAQRPVVFYEFLPRGTGGVIEAFAQRHDLVDVRLGPTEAIVGDRVRFQQEAWNHALVPREDLTGFLETLRSSHLAVIGPDLGG